MSGGTGYESWSGELPQKWELIELKRFASNPKLLNRGMIEGNILALTMRGVIKKRDLEEFSLVPDNYEGYQIFETDDLAFKLIDLENISTSRVGLVPERGIMSPAYVRISLNDTAFPKYFYYFFYSLYLQNIFNSLGAGVRSTLTANELLRLRVPRPPLPEQRAIVGYLDAKLAQIDQFVANKRRLIELLQEQKQVIVNRYVTRGLDDTAELKDSGLEWLGPVPKHWEMKRAKYYFYEVDERSELGEEEMLSVSHITGVTPRSEKNVTMFMSESNEGQKICQPDDVVINILWAWMGALGVSRHYGIVSPAYGVYRQRGQLFEFGYLDGLLRHKGYVGEYGIRSKGVTSSRARMYTDDFFNIPYPRPPLSEQRAIVARIEAETAAIARAVAHAEREIELIGEYRTTLISEAVTGKIDVRGWEGE